MRSLRFGAVVISAVLAIGAGAGKSRKGRTAVHGRVALADGSSPQFLVAIQRVCSGAPETAGYADSEGRFSVEFGNDEEANLCALRAQLPGYRSTTLRAGDANESGGLGTLVLYWRGKSDAAARTTRLEQMPKPALKEYESARDEAARGKIHNAEDLFEQTSKLFYWASPAYVALGMLYEREGNSLEAKKAYDKAIVTEETCVLPYAYAVTLEIARQEWQAALEHSKKLIAFDAAAFPIAWYANAQASLNLHDLATAEASARQGLVIDADHEYPELEYVLALALDDKGDRDGAVQHLKSYLALNPQGRGAAAAREQLGAWQTRGNK